MARININATINVASNVVSRALATTFAVFMLWPLCAQSEEEKDRIHLEATVITGNQELPKVLYILPWQEIEGDAVPPARPTLQQELAMKPIYPHQYRRELAFRELTRRQADTKANPDKSEED